ncbi:hypothetical protein B4589_014515 [Halolamina sp. CBA1230]|uniref:DUF7471 family protein n=1 Tax=Halolamina sp. CBA1230 TaxID=1853690 RepID=UPI001594401C|nr:hypothetical protein [Halolamina sp. CBA1230]QKY21526.1 hypothetical protein B4589_014515 [Halolamina sp. CBA1230]
MLSGLGVPLAAGVHGRDPVTFALLSLAAVLTAVVAGVGIAAFVRRRSRRYLLVALALSTLLARSAIGLGAYAGAVGPGPHHTLEHALDVVMAALVIAAVYLVGTPADSGAARADGGDPGDLRDGGDER